MMDQGDAWQQFKNARRKMKPSNYMTLTQEQEEEFVTYWENLYKDDAEGQPLRVPMDDIPTENEIVNSLRSLKRKKASGPD